MKKPVIIIASFLAGTLFATATGAVFAEDGLQQVSALIRSDLSILVNGKPAQLNNEVLSYNGKTYLYLRDMETVAGVKVGWDATTKEINIQTSATGAITGGTSAASSPDSYFPSIPAADVTNSVVSETTFQNIPALNIDGTVYFRKTEFESKFLDIHSKTRTWKVSALDHTLTLIYDDESKVIALDNPVDFRVVNGNSYINSKYFPTTLLLH